MRDGVKRHIILAPGGKMFHVYADRTVSGVTHPVGWVKAYDKGTALRIAKRTYPKAGLYIVKKLRDQRMAVEHLPEVTATGLSEQRYTDVKATRNEVSGLPVEKGWTFTSPGARLLQSVTRRGDNLRGQAAYEQDLAETPRYHDGKLRPTWDQLSPIAKDSWERQPELMAKGPSEVQRAAPHPFGTPSILRGGARGPEGGPEGSYRFTLYIDTDTDAFRRNREGEVARILSFVAHQLITGKDDYGMFRTLRDANGNDVGRAKFERRD